MCMQLICNQRGQSIIQVLISIGLMSILMAAFATMMANQSKESQALAEKIAWADFQQQLSRTFTDGALCTSLIGTMKFDSTNAIQGSKNQPTITLSNTSIPISSLPNAPPLVTAGQPASSISSTLIVASVNPFQVTNIVGSSAGGVGYFTGVFQVNFDKKPLIRALKPAQATIGIQTTSSGNTQTIIGCQSTGGNSLGAMGYKMVTNVCNNAYDCTVSCPTGQQVLGGGGVCWGDAANGDKNAGGMIGDSFPINNNTGWSVGGTVERVVGSGYVYGDKCMTLTVWASCANK